jgi:hypothetical protein
MAKTKSTKTAKVMIEELTPEQESMFSVYRDKWTAVGLCTDPIDRDRAIAAVNKAYECGGLPPPNQILFADGPMHAKQMLSDMGINNSLDSLVFGQHEAYWVAFYDFFQTECKLDLGGKLDGMMAMAKECGWTNVYDTLAVVQSRPNKIKMDDQNRIHCEDGPCIEYPDGTQIYGWHGVRVPKEWFTDRKSLTPQIALTWENTEQRRAACEILGWARVLRELDSSVIDEDADPMIGTLIEVEIPEIGREKFLKVLCGTGREFAIPVPPEMKTALEANAWTYDIPSDVLSQLEVRT